MWPLFKIVNLFYLLVSSYIWFAFLLPNNIVPLIVSGFMIVCFALGNFNVKFTSRVYALFGVLILYFLYGTFILGISYGLLTLLSYIPAILLFMLDEGRQEDLLKFVTKWMCILMGISIVAYLLNTVISLPHFRYLPPQLVVSYDPFDNYIFFLKNQTMYNSAEAGVRRFSGPFLEPGHQSLVCSLILFANRFKMKSQPLMWILVISIIMSFSLAGYLILFIGLCLIKIRSIRAIIALGTLILSGIFIVTNVWNNGDNPVKILILDRLEFDGTKGIKGNNRTIIQTDYFFKKCVEDGTIWLGVRTQKEMKLKIRGAGYKIFMLKYGACGLFFVFALYLLLIPPRANRRYAVSFFLLIVIVFLQRAYPSWYSWLLCYTLGIGIMRYRNFKGELLYDHPEEKVTIPESDVEEDSSEAETDISQVEEQNNH